MSNDEARQPARTLALGRPTPQRAPKPEQVEVPASLGAPRRSLGAADAPAVTTTQAAQRVAPVDTIAVAADPEVPSFSSPEPFEAPTALVNRRGSVLTPAAPIEKKRTRTALTVAPAMHKELAKPLNELIPDRGPQELRQTFIDLVRAGASDVHIRRSLLQQNLSIEARVDGIMQTVQVFTGEVAAKTAHTLLKTDAGMASDVNRVPEDGTYSLEIDGFPYRARVASLPLFDGGEKLTLRLPQTGQLRHIDDLGFTPENLEKTKEIASVPGGMTLFAGPTGEGKSTTALSVLTWLKSIEDGIFITLEDPVERVLPGFEQVEVKEEIEGAGFGDMMKYVVRSDPNVLFIGEIRDARTATAAVEIAKSGIRVVATIHAKDNISGFMRVVEMAEHPPLSVLESVNGVVSQRLVRRLVQGHERFAGRYPIHEATSNTTELTDALIANVSRGAIQAAAAGSSTTFRENVDALIEVGVTTRAEARKVVRDV